MVLYNFKTIQVVPTNKDFIDIVLSKTQRQTPTVVHNGWAIARIRQFYMRKVGRRKLTLVDNTALPFRLQAPVTSLRNLKAHGHSQVKFTQSNWHDKLTKILEDFPKVDDMHPFFGDLLNVLYDRDHYKLALGQLHTARSLIAKVSQGEALDSKPCQCCCPTSAVEVQGCLFKPSLDADLSCACRLCPAAQIW
jgi:nucleolar GTP-binding protein